MRYLLLVFFALFFFKPVRAAVFIDPSELPKKLYIALHYSDSNYRHLDLKERRYLDNLLKENLKVSFYSKGFKVLQIRKVRHLGKEYLLSRFSPSEGEGILALDITDVSFTYAVVAGSYKLAGYAYLYNSEGKLLGKWYVEASKGEIHIPMSIGDVAKIFLQAITHNGEQIIYNIAQVFVKKLAMQIPDLPQAAKAVKVYFVNWFIGDPNRKVFEEILKRGDLISVAAEAQPGLQGYLIIDGLKGKIKKVPLTHTTSSPQIYVAKYTLREGDWGTDVAAKVVFTNRFGDKLEIEYPKYFQIDAVPPLPPVNLTASVLGSGVQLNWDMLKYDADFDHFEIFKRDESSTQWQLIGKTRDRSFFDKEVSEGHIYLYKVVSVDRVGNRSDDNKSPVAEVVIPLKETVFLENRPLEGVLKPATYIVGKNVEIPRGKSLYLKYVKLVFIKPLTVKGELVAEKSEFDGNPNDVLFSQQVYPNSDCLVVDGGRVSLRDVKFKECRTAIFVKSGSLKGKGITFDNNFINVISYEPKRVVLENVDFGTDKVENFRLRGKLIVKSFIYNGYKRPLDLNKLYLSFQNWVVSYLSLGNFQKVKELYKAYMPLFVEITYPYEDKKLVKYCKQFMDKECLKDYLPALIKLYPDNENFALDYATVLPPKKRCRFLKDYEITHSVTSHFREIEKMTCGGF